MAGPGSYLIGDEELGEVIEVKKTGHLSRYGNLRDDKFRHKVYSFEKSFAGYCGADYGLATSSGMASLLIALLASELKPGDEVFVPTSTFVAT